MPGREEQTSFVFNEYRVSFWENEKVEDMDVVAVAEKILYNHASKMGRVIHFMSWVFYYNKKIYNEKIYTIKSLKYL